MFMKDAQRVTWKLPVQYVHLIFYRCSHISVATLIQITANKNQSNALICDVVTVVLNSLSYNTEWKMK